MILTTKHYTDTNFLKKDGSTQLTSNWDTGSHQLYISADPNHSNSLARKSYIDYHINNQINGDRNFHNNKITSLKAGTDDTDSINKKTTR